MARQGSTVQLAVLLRRTNPCATLEQIAVKIGVTRQRVEQILRRASLPTKHWIKPKNNYECPGCRKPLRRLTSRCPCLIGTFVCDICGKEIQRRVSFQRALFKRGYKHIFCSEACR